MQSALHIKTQVLPGNKIEIQSDNLVMGETVDVFVVIPQNGVKKKSSVMDIIKKIRHNRTCFKTAEEIDQQIQEEKESWDF
jgi:uncharacterized protein (DUF3084 family)